MHVNPGSVLHLRCIVRNLIEKPGFIFWYHTKKDGNGDPELINYAPRVKMSILDGEVDPMNQTNSPAVAAPSATANNASGKGHVSAKEQHHQQRHEASSSHNNKHQAATATTLASMSAATQAAVNGFKRHGGGFDESLGLTVTGLLTIERVRVADSGNFTCSPQHASASVISVHVLSEGKQDTYEKYNPKRSQTVQNFVVISYYG
jgi:hypothetical protein